MEKETIKLINVVRRIARAAGYAAWIKTDPEAARFCVTQYNRVLSRLGELETGVKTLFTPLPENASPEVTCARGPVAFLCPCDAIRDQEMSVASQNPDLSVAGGKLSNSKIAADDPPDEEHHGTRKRVSEVDQCAAPHVAYGAAV